MLAIGFFLTVCALIAVQIGKHVIKQPSRRYMVTTGLALIVGIVLTLSSGTIFLWKNFSL